MTPPAVLFDEVSFAYPGGGPALERVSLRVEQGEMVAVIGPNGGGKSTLIRLLTGALTGCRGRIEVMGCSPEEARRRGLVGYVPQRSEAERSFPVSVRQAVAMPALARLPGWRPEPAALRRRVQRCMERVGVAELSDCPVGTLSGGQWQRVLIARALALEPRVLALDEPLVGIDAPGQRLFADLLRTLRREMGLTILLVSHDLRAVAVAGAGGDCDKVACLRRTLHFHDSPHGVTPQVLAEVFSHDLSDVFGEVHVDAHRAAECADHAHPHAPPSHGSPRTGGGR